MFEIILLIEIFIILEDQSHFPVIKWRILAISILYRDQVVPNLLKNLSLAVGKI